MVPPIILQFASYRILTLLLRMTVYMGQSLSLQKDGFTHVLASQKQTNSENSKSKSVFIFSLGCLLAAAQKIEEAAVEMV